MAEKKEDKKEEVRIIEREINLVYLNEKMNILAEMIKELSDKIDNLNKKL